MAKKNKVDVFLTRDSYLNFIEIWPATAGIRKFHGCVQYGAAWSSDWCTNRLSFTETKYAETIYYEECQKRYGFVPRKGTAWLIEGDKKTKVDIDFSN